MERSASDQSPRRPPLSSPPLYSFGRPWPEFNDGLSYTDVIKCTTSAPTLIDFYVSNYKNSAPIEGWLHRIQNGQITIDGKVVKDPDCILREGCKVVYHRLPWKEPSTPYLLDVLYEDDDIVAVIKPSGLQVLPGGLFQQRTVLTQLQWRDWRVTTSSPLCTKQRASQAHPVPVHRLGRGTSGLLLCAKTKIAKVGLASYFAEGTANARSDRDGSDFCNTRQISKFYRALVTGIIENDEVIITQPIGLVKYAGVAQGLYVASSTGKSAMSKVHVLERDMQRNQTLVQVEIQSGRPHQIRIHLSYIGHPLLGDPLYCNGGMPKINTADSSNRSFAEDGGYEKPVQPVPGDCGYHLHAHWLVLSHPASHERIRLVAPLPSLLQTQAERAQVL
ncbi:RNA pseudouridine synthase 5-like protein [Carex littledalei]|uniref:RNA pseudouridine synthase 5-like protein n=1 Tax=Carex littledalei TaxID=544730 RepID=A0A833VD98_9POAL|nr:RNA pseudouridine synthase 5-like protein [Carex littledalei]